MKKAAITKKKESADEDETADDESDKKISRGASASHGDLVAVLEVTFLGFGKGDGEPLFRVFGGFASVLCDDL